MFYFRKKHVNFTVIIFYPFPSKKETVFISQRSLTFSWLCTTICTSVRRSIFLIIISPLFQNFLERNDIFKTMCPCRHCFVQMTNLDDSLGVPAVPPARRRTVSTLLGHSITISRDGEGSTRFLVTLDQRHTFLKSSHPIAFLLSVHLCDYCDIIVSNVRLFMKIGPFFWKCFPTFKLIFFYLKP